MEIRGISQIEQELAYKFFVIFSRFECTAKVWGYTAPSPNGQIKIDRGCIAQKVKDNFDELLKQDKDLQEAIDFYSAHPPKKQTLQNNKVIFMPVCDSAPIVLRLLNAVGRVRNNLFHGGKGFDDTDEERSEKLVEYGATIMLAIVQCDENLNSYFHEGG